MTIKLSRYPLNADGTPMDLLVGVLTDANGNGGARLANVPRGPDNSPIDSVALVLVDSAGNFLSAQNVPDSDYGDVNVTSGVWQVQSAQSGFTIGGVAPLTSALFNQPNGVPQLDATTKIPASLLPSYGSTDAVVEGAVNLYFSQPRVRDTPLTGLAAAAGSLAATDTLLGAMGKVKYALDNATGWTYNKLAADYVGSTAVAEDTGIELDATALDLNSTYEVELHALVKVASANFTFGYTVPGNCVGSIYAQSAGNTATTTVQGDFAEGAKQSSAVNNSAVFCNVIGQALIVTGASAPTGSIKFQVKNSTGSATHTVSKGSFIKWKKAV